MNFSFSQKKQTLKTTPSVILPKDGFAVTIDTKNLEKEKLVLYFLFGPKKQKVIVDSTIVSKNDEVVTLKNTKKVLGAIYNIKFSNSDKFIELALDNGTEVGLTLNYKNIDSVKCVKNNLNIDFLNYQRTKTTNKLNNAEARKKLIKKYPTSILALYFEAENLCIEKPKDSETKTLLAFKNNYFSKVKLSDKRLFLLPNLFKLYYNFVNIYPVNSDNYNKCIDYLLNGLDCKSNIFKVTVKWLVSNLQFYEAKNMDNSFIYLYTKYIDNDKCKTFDDFEMNEFRNKYQGILKLPYKTVAPDFTFETTKGEPFSIAENFVKNDFTFLIFYSPSCSHCEENVPKNKLVLENLKIKYPNKTFQFVSILNDTDESKWDTFIKKAGLDNWINLKTTKSDLSYQEKYNAFSNPNYLMLNKKGEVILKTFNLKAIEDLIKNN